jgi:hypothetical protein
VTDHRVIYGDCLHEDTGMACLADKSVDHVICDPPYSEHVHGKQRRGGKMPGEEGSFFRAAELGFAALTLEEMDAAASQFSRLARRWVLVFCNAEFSTEWMRALTRHGLRHVRIGAWVKGNATPQFTGDRPGAGFETVEIAHAAGGRTRWNGGGRPGVWEHMIIVGRGGDEERVHTTQKPEGLMEALVRDFTDPGELILDPFAGSGTTGVACKRLGRRFIGFERDAKYHAIAERRIRNAREQLGLWDGAA